MGKIKRLSTFLFLLCYACNSSHDVEKKFYLQGEVDVKDGTKVYLKSQEFYEIIEIDSSTVKKSKFQFSGTVDRPVIYGIYVENIPGVLGIFMENDSIMALLNPKDLSTSSVKGSALNNAYHKFIKHSYGISAKIDQLYPLFQKARSEDNLVKLKDINERMKSIQQESTQYALQYAKKNPDSYVAAFALHSVLTSGEINLDTIKKIYSNFSSFVKKGDFSLEILHYITEKDSLY